MPEPITTALAAAGTTGGAGSLVFYLWKRQQEQRDDDTDGLRDADESLREEMDRRFERARQDRQRVEREAREGRSQLRVDMGSGFDQLAERIDRLPGRIIEMLRNAQALRRNE